MKEPVAPSQTTEDDLSYVVAVTKAGPRVRIRHMADKIREDGAVSAVCFMTPRPIDMKRSTWTIRAEAVTCPKCIKAMA